MTYDEIQIADALSALPPAPIAWVQAAQELPRLERLLQEIVGRIEQDPEFRTRTMTDLETALLEEGYEPEPALVEALRHRLGPG
jgi:hypothetical protein